MNREQREQYEQVTTDTPFKFHWLLGTLHFSKGRKPTGDTPFFVRGFRAFRGYNYCGRPG